MASRLSPDIITISRGATRCAARRKGHQCQLVLGHAGRHEVYSTATSGHLKVKRWA